MRALTSSWWLSVVQVINSTSSMLADEAWTNLKWRVSDINTVFTPHVYLYFLSFCAVSKWMVFWKPRMSRLYVWEHVSGIVVTVVWWCFLAAASQTTPTESVMRRTIPAQVSETEICTERKQFLRVCFLFSFLFLRNNILTTPLPLGSGPVDFTGNRLTLVSQINSSIAYSKLWMPYDKWGCKNELKKKRNIPHCCVA